MVANVIAPQAGARRLTRLIREIAIGDTPVAGTWDQLRNTGGDGVSAGIETQESNELSGSGALGQIDQVVTGKTGAFTYPCELSSDPPFELFFESLLQSTWATDQLLPGSTDVTMTIEDELPDVDEFEYLAGARVNTMQLVINANEIVTVEFAGAGTGPGVSARLPLAGATLAGSTITGAIPTDVEVGSFVQVENATDPTDNGYYAITAVTPTTDVTVAGTFVGGTGDCEFTGISLSDGGSTNAKGLKTPFAAGNSVTFELDEPIGAGFVDSLNFGLRVPSLTLNVGTEVSDLREITEDSAYVQVATNRAITLDFDWHVINLAPVRFLDENAEFGVRFKVADDAGNSYEFTFPRCKFSESSKGTAENGSEMTGSSSIVALLNQSGINIQVDRVNV